MKRSRIRARRATTRPAEMIGGNSVCPMCWREHDCIRVNGAWLRYVRTQNHLSLRETARRLRISAAYLCDIELGRRNCPETVHVWYRNLDSIPQLRREEQE